MSLSKDTLSSMTCEQIQSIWASEPEVLGILDLRPAEEFRERHIPGAQNVSLVELRQKVVGLDDKLAVLICPDDLVVEATRLLVGKDNYVFMKGCERWFENPVGACSGNANERSLCVETRAGIPEVHVDEVNKTLGRVRLIDVRRPDEFNAELGHIRGAELHTLGPELSTFLRAQKDSLQEIVFVCRSGKRSEAATLEALAAGYGRVSNMVGGMLFWNERGHPVVRE